MSGQYPPQYPMYNPMLYEQLRNVVPIYNTVKYAIFMKFSDVVRLFSQFYQKKNRVIRMELESELISLILLIISSYEKNLGKTIINTEGKFETFKKVYKRFKNEANLEIKEEEIPRLLVEIPIILNIIGVTDIALKSRSTTDDFAGF